MFIDKTLLITGGTGSLGTAFCNHLIENNMIPNMIPKKLIIFSRDWLKQKNLRTELDDPEFMRWRIGDVRDKDRLRQAFKDADYIIHAAALKDLPSAEENPDEAMSINAEGTKNVRDIAIECGVKKAILISTDKACNPINTYGMSKAVAERYFLDGNVYSAGKTKFSVCRYGNVINSNGSVIPVWKKLIEDGAKELPVTDERMTRFFYPMEDAIKLILYSLATMQGGELFIPRIPSIRIIDLAAAFGMPYKVTGIRPGEKLHESLEDGYNSGTNPHFLTVEEIKKQL
jgi:UDP-N-acetylglucosamine 4,6-dehydratase